MTQAEYDEEWYKCQQEAVKAGALKPQGVMERMAAGHILNQGGFWRDTARAKDRLDEWTRECMRRKGYQA
jgi:hypothetical protein